MQSYPMTSKDVAEAFSISESHVRTLALAGKIPAIKVGTQWRYNYKAVAKALVRVMGVKLDDI